jgi:two-component system, OmpR family, phosphate regulon sensor histidine kinase PhoR
VSERDSGAASFRRESAADLDALGLRLQALRARLETIDAPVDVADDLDAALRDVRQAEAQLAARTRAFERVSVRLQTIVEELPQGVILIDARGQLEVANRLAEEIFGVTRDELADVVSANSWAIFDAHGDELEISEQPILKALEQAESTLAERFVLERPDGQRVVIELSAIPVREPEGGSAAIVTVQDVTARARRERAERDFVTNAAHELQTPLAAITSAVEVLQAGAKERPSDRDLFLGHVARACARLDRLTRALLVLARAQMDSEPPRTEVIALAPLLESVASALRRDRVVDVTCDERVAVVANRPLLEQALANIGHNAVKHTDGRVLLAAEPGNGRVRISVHDSGRGIDDRVRERIFERFFRADDPDTEGAGLGLAIVAEVARVLNGELEVDTSPRGTTITLALPAAHLVKR